MVDELEDEPIEIPPNEPIDPIEDEEDEVPSTIVDDDLDEVK